MFCPIVGLIYFSSNPEGLNFHHCVLNNAPSNELCERAEVSRAMALQQEDSKLSMNSGLIKGYYQARKQTEDVAETQNLFLNQFKIIALGIDREEMF